jgi:hypothetical protein
MQPIELVTVNCPHCGAAFETAVDLSATQGSWVEDCQACCSPIEVRAYVEGRELRVEVRREND